MAVGNRNSYYDEMGHPLVVAGENAREAEFRVAERERTALVRTCREYYDGTQFNKINEARALALGQVSVEFLPAHERLHAYSTQIQDSIDYIATQMGDSFQIEMAGDKPKREPKPKPSFPGEETKRPEPVEVPPNPVLEMILRGLQRSPDLLGADTEQNLTLVNNIREALIASDTPALILWDPIEMLAWPQFWDSEHVEFRFQDRDRTIMEEARTTESVWVEEPITGEPQRKILHQRWMLDELGQCVITRWYDEDDPHDRESTGLPFIPWANLRARKKSTKSLRGESAITEQLRATADRFNANEQIGYLISRYNSHGNLAVIGDATSLKAQLDQRINKDVADILTFPGGTALQVISLPTDTQMILAQKATLLAAMYDGFGLTRTDSEALGELSLVTGYALEILNRKTDGTFNQIKSRYVGDFKTMLNMMLDVTAYKQTEDEDLYAEDGILAGIDPLADPETAVMDLDFAMADRLRTLDPMLVFPPEDRAFKITLGTGYVVDTVLLQTEYEKKLISRRYYLSQKGLTPQEIDDMEDELDYEKPPEPEIGLSAGAIGAAGALIAGKGGKDSARVVKGADKEKAPLRG